MTNKTLLQPIVIYLVDRHPLEISRNGSRFRWMQFENDYKKELRGLIGNYDESDLTLLVDPVPAGPEWERLLHGLLGEKVRMVVTHLAPLTSAQRQQLIGICDQTGARLITPADAGRNRIGEENLPDS